MAEQSSISWTDATFNPWWGCWPVSPGCALCYADREASRHGYSDLWQKAGPRRAFGEAHWNEPRRWARNLPRKLGRRPRVFCASMADVGEDHPVAEAERPKLWRLVEQTPELDWLLLTKRTATARKWLPAHWLSGGWPPHAWFGFSAEDQPRYDERASAALSLGAPVTFCSYEPALGPVDFRFPAVLRRTRPEGWEGMGEARREEAIATAARAEYIARSESLSWVIGGGESARPAARARPMHPDWIRSARDQCIAAGVAFHFKQWGEYVWRATRGDSTGRPKHYFDDGVWVELVGKKEAGRELDGRTWDEFPEPRG